VCTGTHKEGLVSCMWLVGYSLSYFSLLPRNREFKFPGLVNLMVIFQALVEQLVLKLHCMVYEKHEYYVNRKR
jgi:hypothetical protein